jgi:3'(2'), 5'-bisphosphate nucleotidase
MPYETERVVAIEAVLKAVRLCQAIQQNLGQGDILAKSNKSPVTIADFGAQALIIHHLRQHFPADPLVGEEDASALRHPDQEALKAKVVRQVQAIEPVLTESAILNAIDVGARPCDFTKRYWTLDPIDGTKGFLRGDQYAVALALIEQGQPVLGVLGCPNLPLDIHRPERGQGCLFVAVAGQGAFMRTLAEPSETRIHVDAITDPQQAVLCESVEADHASHDDHARIAAALGITASPYRLDSQCKYASVARGDASFYMLITTNYQSWIWDHAAGVVIVQEAGGVVTDTRGATLDFSHGRKLSRNFGVLASNGTLHQVMLDAIRRTI